MASSLAHDAARGTLFTFVAQALRILLQIVSVVVLARLLSPHEYGLLAIVLVMVGLGEIFRDFGLTSASIQARNLSTGQRDNLFWLNTGIGLALAGMMAALAWPLAAFTGLAELFEMTLWLSLIFVCNGLATQHRASLMRGLQLRALAVVDVTAAALALAAAIGVAAMGAGFWALVVQQVGTALTSLIGALIAGRWLPRKYSKAHSVRAMLGLGGNLVGANLIQYAARRIDTVVVGMQFGTVALGLYDRAFHLVMTPLGQVRAPLQSVALPVLSRLQDDQPRFSNWVSGAQLALGYVIGIPLAVVAGLAEPVVDIMLGSAWADTAPLLRFMAIAGLLTTLTFVGYWVYLARGLGAQLLRYTLVTSAIKIICVVVGSYFGLIGVAVAFAVHPAIAVPVSFAWLSRITALPTRRLALGAVRIVIVTTLSGWTAWLIGSLTAGWGSWAQTFAGSLLGLLVATAVLVVPVYRRDAGSLLAFVRLMFTRRTGAARAAGSDV